MSDGGLTIEEKVERLSEEVRRLSARVDSLAGQSVPRENYSDYLAQADAVVEVVAPAAEPANPERAGATILAGAAASCFLLVIALILRTIADNGVIDKQWGVGCGLAYAWLVLIYGYHRCGEKKKLAHLFVVCGAALTLSMVLETHVRFDLISARTAYEVLAGMLTIMFVLGWRTDALVLLNVGIPGAGIVAFALDFPEPWFLQLLAFVAYINVLSYAVRWHSPCRWLASFSVAATIFFWVLWTVKLRAPLLRGDGISDELALQWYLPMLLVFSIAYLAAAIWAMCRRDWPYGIIERVLLFIAGVGGYLCAWAVIAPLHKSERMLGVMGTTTAFLFIALALGLVRFTAHKKHVGLPLSLAALSLLAVSLHAVTGNGLMTVTGWCLFGLGLALLAQAQRDIRVAYAACVFEAFTCLWALALRVFTVGETFSVGRLGVLLVLGVLCAMYYTRLRSTSRASTEPSTHADYRTPVLLVFCAIVYLLAACRIALFHGLTTIGLQATDAFQCGQSMIVSVGAFILGLAGLQRKNRELLATAVAMAIFGAGKVFAYDLIKTQGVPLVLNVLTFGLTMTAGSLLWNRWQD